MNDAPVSGIRPALETLRELDGKQFLDKLALQIHDATVAVEHHMRPARLTITLDFAALQKTPVSEPAITIEADITSKLPKPAANRALFFIDADGNPTTQQTRQREMDLKIAERDGRENLG